MLCTYHIASIYESYTYLNVYLIEISFIDRSCKAFHLRLCIEAMASSTVPEPAESVPEPAEPPAPAPAAADGAPGVAVDAQNLVPFQSRPDKLEGWIDAPSDLNLANSCSLVIHAQSTALTDAETLVFMVDADTDSIFSIKDYVQF